VSISPVAHEFFKFSIFAKENLISGFLQLLPALAKLDTPNS